MKPSCFRHALPGIAICLSFSEVSQNNLPQLGKDPISQVINAMILEEKASLVVSTGLPLTKGFSK